MQKQKSVYNHLIKLEKSTSDAQKAIGCQPKKRKTKPIKNIKINIRIKIKLSSIMPHLLIQVSLRYRLSRKTSVMDAAKGTIQLLGLRLIKFLRKTKIRIKSKT